MAEILDLYKGSNKTLRFSVKEIPTGATVTGAKWMLKKLTTDADEDALITKDAVSVAEASIEDDGADGTAVVEVYIDPTDCDALSNYDTSRASYVSGLKLQLDDDRVFIVPGTISTTRIYGAVVESDFA